MENNFKTARELMEARYAAYERGDIEFIVATHSEHGKSDLDVEATKAWALESKWLGLEIISTTQGEESDEYGIVEFKATYEEKGKLVVHHEKSEFVKENGKWLYEGWLPLQGTIVKGPKIKPNDPCICGSGKKYKKCCGK